MFDLTSSICPHHCTNTLFAIYDDASNATILYVILIYTDRKIVHYSQEHKTMHKLMENSL